ncbi:MAG TPA: hypothetical protein VNG93_14225 [Candidatus Dormibacteraeota bacterium]|nr:hypothetical protein [Candidatus Dormibacteraeota bacterium]
METQDLDAAERPAEALLFEPVEGERHQPGAARAGVVDALVAAAQKPEAHLRVLGDAVLVPAAHLLQRAVPDEAHGAPEDDGVAVGPRRHADVEEVAVAVKEAPQVLVVLPVEIALGALHEGDVPVGEVADEVLQEAGLDDVVGVHDGDHLVLGRWPPGGLVEGAGLEAGPIGQVHELEARAQLHAERLKGAPRFLVGRVVVHNLDH